MKKSIIVLFLVLIAIFVFWKIGDSPEEGDDNLDTSVDTLSDGTISFSHPYDFGLAVSKEQILASSYIPPCGDSFLYCLYYNGEDFQGTNFDSAGIRIEKRIDLNAERLCLDTPPRGYTNLSPSSVSHDSYSASIFSPIGDAGAGHYSNGELYRIYLKEKSICYEIETRIGESQFANYEPGTIKKFSESDRDKIYNGFRKILNSLIIDKTRENIRLPDSEN